MDYFWYEQFVLQNLSVHLFETGFRLVMTFCRVVRLVREPLETHKRLVRDKYETSQRIERYLLETF